MNEKGHPSDIVAGELVSNRRALEQLKGLLKSGSILYKETPLGKVTIRSLPDRSISVELIPTKAALMPVEFIVSLDGEVRKRARRWLLPKGADITAEFQEQIKQLRLEDILTEF